ncbi:MAK10-like protein [Tanacetum coccineum]
MTSNSKVGLGYGIKSNNEVLSYEEEMNCTVFNCTEEDFVDKPLYNRFSKTDNLKGVPHPLTGDYTPKPQQEIDESLYVYGKKGPQKHKTSVSDDKFNEYSTCQSNDSEGSFGNPSEHSVEFESESISVPKEVSESKSVTTNEKVMSEPKPKDVEPSCVTHVKTPRQPMKNQETPKVNGKNWNEMMERELGEGYSFIKKKCFVCSSLSHLIRDCDFYEKKMAREAELKKQRVFNTGNGVAKLVWNNANRVNHANHFVPRPVQLNAVRQNVKSVRSNINTVRPKQPVPTSNSNSFSSVRPQVNKFNQRSNFSKSHSPVRRPIVRNTTKMPYAVKGNWGTAVKTSAGYNWRNTRPNSNCNSGSNFVRTDHPLKNMEDRGIFDSGCSGHMTGNKDHLDDFEECKGGSVTFGGSKGYITGKGRIRVGNLEFDSVSFVKELGHFNLFSISQICDKQHKVLFTETECLVVSPDFKMPDENQILLKVPRQHNMYSFDMKTPAPTKDYACLIAKATSDESKLWHRRLKSGRTILILNQDPRKVKTGLRRKLDADEVNTGEGINTGFTDVNTAFEEINESRPEQRTALDKLKLTLSPQAYARAVYSNPYPRTLNEPPKQNPFTFCARTGPNPQPQALGTTFEARVRDYMAAHTERMKRFENAIFKHRGEINDRMTEMFGLLMELTTSRAPEKVLIREETKHPVTKNVNSISLIRGEEKMNADDNATSDDNIERPDESDAEVQLNKVDKENEAKNRTKNEPLKSAEKKSTQFKEVESLEVPNSQAVGYYLKHRINEKLIEGLVENHRFNDSLSAARVGKMKWKTYKLLPRGPIYEAILKKKITKKEDIGVNFEIPCNIGGLNHMNALVDQGSDVNVMPLSTYKKLTNERPTKTDIRVFLASHSYIYPLGITEDVLVDVAGYVYPVDFVILDIKEDEKRPFILRTPF